MKVHSHEPPLQASEEGVGGDIPGEGERERT